MPRYDELWTAGRMRKVIDAAVRARVAIEINSRVPDSAIGVPARCQSGRNLKFSFGSNMHSEAGMGRIDFCRWACTASSD